MDQQIQKKQIDQSTPICELSPEDQRFEQKRQVLIKRISVSIVLLLKENPMLPFHFNFMGECLLESLKEERYIYKQRKAGFITMSKLESTEFDKESKMYQGASASSFMTPAVIPPNQHYQDMMSKRKNDISFWN